MPGQAISVPVTRPVAISSGLETAGVEFIDKNGGGPGVFAKAAATSKLKAEIVGRQHPASALTEPHPRRAALLMNAAITTRRRSPALYSSLRSPSQNRSH